jgi:hypothetical protein
MRMSAEWYIKFEIRISKLETNTNDQNIKFKTTLQILRCYLFEAFEFLICFVLRILQEQNLKNYGYAFKDNRTGIL